VSVVEPSPDAPTLMTAPTLRIIRYSEDVDRYPIDTGDHFRVAFADYEVWGRPFLSKFIKREWLTPGVIERRAWDPTVSRAEAAKRWIKAQGAHFVVVRRRLTLSTPTGDVICIVDQRGHDPDKSGYRFLSANETSIGALRDLSPGEFPELSSRDNWIFDRHDRPVAQYRLPWLWGPVRVVNGRQDLFATIHKGSERIIEFTDRVSPELRLLIICADLALRIVRMYHPSLADD